MKNTKVKALICGFIFSVLFSFTGFFNRCDCISSKIFRLHIIANSNSKEDQDLKLKVRDRILKDFGEYFGGLNDLIAAKELTGENIEKIKKSAKDEIILNGYDYDVDACVTSMYFNNRKYGDFTIPAGKYDALRITIGQAQGKNWWCVMFPPMCLPAASAKDELEEVLNPYEMDLVEGEGKYKIKFKAVELAVELKEFFDNVFENAF
ncbi:MAG: stage II sporulation protein R [Clostridia bacterium]|nr:stage II sporulation protein R [Clostridia bacterium]